MFFFKFVLLVWLHFLCLPDKNAASRDECYYSNTKSGENWKLVWQDEFEADQLNSSNWKTDHLAEYGHCRYGPNWHSNCHHRENVWTTDGLMVMMVKKMEKYSDGSFTGASITTTQFFNYSRIEIRAIVPIEEYIPVIFFTHNDNDLYWTETGQIIIMNVYDQINHRGFYPFGSRSQTNFIPNDFKFNRNVNNSFHRYGVEWSDRVVRFFFDDDYVEAGFLYNSDPYQVKQTQQLRIQIGVFKTADWVIDTINWNCPAFLVDYVRVYEKVQLKNLEKNEIKSKQCTDKSKFELGEAETVVKKICAEASIGNSYKSPNMSGGEVQQTTQPTQPTQPTQTTQPTEILAKPNNSWAYATISILMIIILILVIFVVYKFYYEPRIVANRTTPLDGFELMTSS